MNDKRAVLDRAHARARCITQSWLSSWGIPFEQDGKYLRVRGKTVAFSAKLYYVSEAADVTLHIGPILGRNFDRSMAEVGKLMAANLLRMPEPPRRPTTERAAPDDYLARSMCLSQFTRTANLPEATVLAHRATIKREADRACRRYSDLAHKMTLDPRDFYTIALVFAHIYLHRYQNLDNPARNGANLTLFLQQEFSNWAMATRKDIRNIAIDSRGLLASQVMSAPIPGALVEWQGDGAIYTMPEYQEEEAAPVEPMSRSSARRVLRRTLADMPHDEMVERLATVIRNDYLDYDTRSAAEHRFGQHLQKCEACRAAHEAWSHEHAARRKYTTHQERAA